MTSPAPKETFSIRAARPDDGEVIVRLIEELAEYERLRNTCRAEAHTLREHLFGPKPRAEVLLADRDGEAVGFALFFHTFSTFACAPGLYLEDLYVRPAHRRLGIGRALLERVAGIAQARGCRRLEWAVLDWNSPAIDFYRRLGARAMDDWTVYRMDGPDLLRLARAGARDEENSQNDQ